MHDCQPPTLNSAIIYFARLEAISPNIIPAKFSGYAVLLLILIPYALSFNKVAITTALIQFHAHVYKNTGTNVSFNVLYCVDVDV